MDESYPQENDNNINKNKKVLVDIIVVFLRVWFFHSLMIRIVYIYTDIYVHTF